MHDIKQIRENRDAFVAGLARRAAAFDGKTPDEVAASILDLDNRWRAAKSAFEQHRARQNEASRAIGQAKAKKDEAGAAALLAEVAGLKEAMQKDETAERELEEQLKKALSVLPNLAAADVPDGPDEAFNKEVAARKFGASAKFAFKPKEHYELGEALGLMDFEHAAKVSGARFVYLKGALAKMERALGAFMLDLHTEQFGYTEVVPPLLVRNSAMVGTGQHPKFGEELFYSTDAQVADAELADTVIATVRLKHPELLSELTAIADKKYDDYEALKNWRLKLIAAAYPVLTELRLANKESLWLIPTAEVPLTNYVSGEILDEAQLPLRFTAWTPCFRAEAGAAGRDTKGMIRQHQFSKVELVSITTPEQSLAEHERMTDCAQEVLKRLGLPHQVMTLSTGDMGFSAQKTYDIEVWLPGQDRYREISSCSNCGEFQARRMNTRYRPKEGKNTRFVHTLNGSGLAVGRTLIAVLENYQESDGSIAIPDALVPYMGGLKKIEKK
jgi:seryl-tRNA synthetase